MAESLCRPELIQFYNDTCASRDVFQRILFACVRLSTGLSIDRKLRMIQYILDYCGCAHLELKDSNTGMTVLHTVVKNSVFYPPRYSHEVASLLLSKGADVHTRDIAGNGILSAALHDTFFVRLLLQHAAPCVANFCGSTPFHQLTTTTPRECVKSLFAHAKERDQTNGIRETARASYLHQVDNSGRSMLHTFAESLLEDKLQGNWCRGWQAKKDYISWFIEVLRQHGFFKRRRRRKQGRMQYVVHRDNQNYSVMERMNETRSSKNHPSEIRDIDWFIHKMHEIVPEYTSEFGNVVSFHEF